VRQSNQYANWIQMAILATMILLSMFRSEAKQGAIEQHVADLAQQVSQLQTRFDTLSENK
jgi:hypothetical protein